MFNLGLTDYLYWFGSNLIKFIVAIPFYPLYFTWCVLGDLFIVVFVWNGSTTLSWPWEWLWDSDD